jgi:hypothetical protein
VRLWLYDSITAGLRSAVIGDEDSGEDGYLGEVWRTSRSARALGVALAIVSAMAYAQAALEGIDRGWGWDPWWTLALAVSTTFVAFYVGALGYPDGKLKLYELLGCPWCLSVHVAGWGLLLATCSGWAAPVDSWGALVRFLATWLTIACGTTFVMLLEQRLDTQVDLQDANLQAVRGED